MQDLMLWAIFGVLIIILMLSAFFIRKKYPHPIDYYAFFVMGLFWIIIGLLFILLDKNYTFFLMGVLFAIFGFVYRDKWKKNRVRWKHLKKPEKIIQIILFSLLAFVIVAGIIFFLFRF